MTVSTLALKEPALTTNFIKIAVIRQDGSNLELYDRAQNGDREAPFIVDFVDAAIADAQKTGFLTPCLACGTTDDDVVGGVVVTYRETPLHGESVDFICQRCAAHDGAELHQHIIAKLEQRFNAPAAVHAAVDAMINAGHGALQIEIAPAGVLARVLDEAAGKPDDQLMRMVLGADEFMRRLNTGERMSCLLCRRPFGGHRMPTTVVLITAVGPMVDKQPMISNGLCRACAGKKRLREKVAAAYRRDLRLALKAPTRH
jgi:hypothetical protein